MRRERKHQLFVAGGALLAALAVLAGIVLLTCGTDLGWACTGLKSSSVPVASGHKYQPEKTLWDWLDLLIIPAALAIVGVLFNARQKRVELAIAKDQGRAQVLATYIDRMSDLLEKSGQATGRDEPIPEWVRASARARTVTAIRQLDSERNAGLLQFLAESGLLRNGDAPIDLNRTDLRGSNLARVGLVQANLELADLRHANLKDAILDGANLKGADLRHANLERAGLSRATLHRAILDDANLFGAFITDDQLREVFFLVGTTMPDGRKFQGWDGQSYETGDVKWFRAERKP